MHTTKLNALLVFTCLVLNNNLFAQITTDNTVFDNNIKTILLFPANDPTQSNVLPCAIDINNRFPLILKFDEINVEDANYYQAKLYHCTADWKLSNLSERQYLYDFNEFNIDKYEFSSNEKIPYTHFTFEVPAVKIPGNYIIVVYKENEEANPAFIKRFFVYDKKIGILAKSSAVGAIHSSSEHQIEFVVDYSKYPVTDPILDLKIVIRQNNRWDNCISDIKPSFIHSDINQLVYRNFNLGNNFKSGNEFRFFDLSSVQYTMQNVDRINKSQSRFDAFLMRDKFRGYEAYSILKDINGGFIISNKDYGSPHLDSEYVNVHFFLEIPEDVRDDIYVVGKLTDWKLAEDKRLKYIEGSNVFSTDLLLKQGVYDYQYVVPGFTSNPNIIEGNHFETKNIYEILVYFNHPVFRTDILLGYTTFE